MSTRARFGLFILLYGTYAAPLTAQSEPIEQWAATFGDLSSRTATSSQGPDQILGAPDNDCGESTIRKGWTAGNPDRGIEWIELKYNRPVYAFSIEVYQSLNPGTVTRIYLEDGEGVLHTVWEGQDTTTDCPGTLVVDFSSTEYTTTVIRLEFDTSLVPGFNEIDAVKLIGFPGDSTTPLIFEAIDPRNTLLPPGFSFNTPTFADYNNDGWPDLLGFGLDDLGFPLLRANHGDGSFGDRTLTLPTRGPNAAGAHIMGDYDNDGDVDLFFPKGSVSRAVPDTDILLRNDGKEFVDVSRAAGFVDRLVSSLAIWLDYDNDSYLDLYVGHFDFQGSTDEYNTLFRNNGDGTFTDVTADVGLNIDFHPEDTFFGASVTGKGTQSGFASADFNEDGWPDLYIPVAFEANRLLLNSGQGRFIDATTADIAIPGVNVGVAIADFDNDGDLDIYQPSVTFTPTGESERSAFLLNVGRGNFVNVTEGVGLGGGRTFNSVTARPLDIDNDGDIDIISTDPVLFFNNQGNGTFQEETYRLGVGGASAIGDYDGDGDLDLWHGSALYRNTSQGHHFLRIELVGTASNRDGIGASVLATSDGWRQMQTLFGAGGYHQDEMIIHYGLGQRTQVDSLSIHWPSGQVDVFTDIPADQTLRVIEGRGEWYPAPRTVWETPPPATVTFGETAAFTAVVRPALFEPTATITSITADLSGLGGPEQVELVDMGDGLYRFSADFTVGGEAPIRDVEVFILQETSLGEHWINLSRNITVENDPFTAVLESYDETTPDAFTLDQNYPNPFNSGTVIRFALPQADAVELAVFNLAGQKVANLIDGQRQAGAYRIHWDGTDDEDRALASGLYLYRLQAGAQTQTKKLLLLR